MPTPTDPTPDPLRHHGDAEVHAGLLGPPDRDDRLQAAELAHGEQIVPRPADLRGRRLPAQREAGDRAMARFLASETGEIREILMERGGIGRTAQFAAVRPDRPAAPGSFMRVRVEGQQGRELLATAL